MNKIAYRHGDFCMYQIDKLPDGLKEANTKTLMTGSNNNPHTFENGQFYPYRKDDFVFGYFVAKNTKLFHREHGKKKVGNLLEAKIKDGIFELRNQVEDTHRGMVKVID